MSVRFPTILTILSVTFTAFVAALVFIGTVGAILLLALTALAFSGWIWAGDSKVPGTVLAKYLMVPPLFLGLSSARFANGWVAHLQADNAALFDPEFVFTGSYWFVVLVCVPTSLILFGGYLLSRGQSAGTFMAWWTALFAIAEGVIQLIGGSFQQTTVLDFLAGGIGVALILAGLAILRRLLVPKAATLPAPTALSAERRRLWALLFLAAVAIYGSALFAQAGLLPVMVVVGSMLGGMVGWWFTTSRIPADPTWAVPLFLLLLTLFYLHIGEEALTDFNGMISKISGKPWADDDFLLLIGLLGPVIWVYAAWSLWHRQGIGNFIFWFLIVGMILGEPVHLLVFPVRLMAIEGIGYEYASGMYTALFPMIPAIIALVRIVGIHRGLRSV